ncbi:MAG: lipopolysaccharide heptosyltransferase II [Elusimicrobiota bacterium]
MTKKILVIRFSSLGDVVLTTPVYKNIKTAWPDCFLAVLVKEQFAALLNGNPYIDQLIVFRRRDSLPGLAGKIRRMRFDILIDLHNNLRSQLVGFFSGASQKIIYQKDAFWRWLFVHWKKSSPRLQYHTIERYLDTCRSLGIEPIFKQPEIFPSQDLPPALAGKEIKKILIIQTAFLGDAVLTLPLVSAAQKNFPQAEISVLTIPQTQEIFSGNPAIKELILYDKKGRERGLLAFWRKAGELGRKKFDLALLPHRSLASALLAYLARIPVRIGFDRSQGKFFLSQRVPFIWSEHDLERNLNLLRYPLNREIENNLPAQIAFDAADERVVENLFNQAGIKRADFIVGLNVGSVWPTKRWPAEKYAQLADLLVERKKAKIVLFGGKADEPAVETAAKKMRHTPLNLCGKTSLKQLAVAIGYCKMFVTNDSGAMHIAVARKIPVVAIFGPTTKELGFFPYGEKNIVVEKNLPCRPCSLHGGKQCPKGHFQCLRLIDPEEVYQAVEKLMRNYKFNT